MKKFRHLSSLSLSRSLLPCGLNFCAFMRTKESKMRKFPTDGLKKCFQLILIVCLHETMNWKSKEPPKRINKLEHPKQVIKKSITNYSKKPITKLLYTESLPHITSYHCIHLLNKLETKFLE